MIYEVEKSENLIETVDNIDRFLDYWNFFVKGYHEMTDPSRANIQDSLDVYEKTMADIALNWPSTALIVLLSKNNKPLAFGAGYNNARRFDKQKPFYIYALYSNGKYRTAVRELLNWCERWARQNGYTELECITGRTTGSAFWWYEKRLGFQRQHVMFKKELA